DRRLDASAPIHLSGFLLKASNAVQTLTSAITAWRSTGSTFRAPLHLTYLAKAHADLGQFDEAWHRLDEAMMKAEEGKEAWFNAEIERFGCEITLVSPQPDAAKAEDHFKRALAVAHQQ